MRYIFAALFMSATVVAQDDVDSYGNYGYDSYGFDPYGYGGYGYGGGYDGYGGDDGYGGPAVETLESEQALESFLASNNEVFPVVIGYIASDSEEDTQLFTQLAEENQFTYKFGLVSDRDMLETRNYDQLAITVYKPSLDVHPKYDRHRARYPGRTIKSVASLERWLLKNAVALVGFRSWETASLYEQLDQPMVMLFTKVDRQRNKKQYDYYANRLRKVATEYKGRYSFVMCNADDYSSDAEEFGWSLDDLEDIKALVGVRDGRERYPMDAAAKFSTESVKEFMQDLADGKLNPKIVPDASFEDGSAEYDDPGASSEVPESPDEL